MKALLSQDFVDALQPDPNGGRVRVWDTDAKGLGLYVTPAGVKSYFVTYWIDGRERRMTLGRADVISLTKARLKARKALNGVADGIDPIQQKTVARATKTIAELWPDFVRSRDWKPSTAAEAQRSFKKTLKPAFGGKRLDALSRAEISAWHRRIGETHKTKANSNLALLKALLNWAVAEELLERSPAGSISLHKTKARETFLAGGDFEVLFAAIAFEESHGGKAAVTRSGKAEKGKRGGKGLKEDKSRGISVHCAGLFRLLALTGARLREIMHAKWQWVQWDERVLALPDSKTGAKRVPLNQQAIAELRRLQAVATTGCEWIIEGNVAGKPLVNATKPWHRTRERAHTIINERREKLEEKPLDESVFTNLRLHDLRHSYASVAVGAGLSLPIIGKALGHSQSRTTERYSHLQVDPVLAAAEIVGALIEAGATASEAARASRQDKQPEESLNTEVS